MWISDYLPFAVVSLGAALVCAIIAVYAWRRRQAPGIQYFVLLMSALSWLALMSTLDYLLSGQLLGAKIFVSKLYMLGGSPAPVLAFLFCVTYTHHDHWLTRPVKWLLWLPVAVELLLVFTNEWHWLYWPQITVTGTDPAARLVFTHSPLTHALAAISYALLFGTAALMLVTALRSPAVYRRQNMLFVLALLIPLLANLLYYLDRGPWEHLDLTPVAFAISGILMAVAIFRHQALDLTPVALDTLFANLADGVVVVNERRLVVSTNPAVRMILGLTEDHLIGRSVEQLPAPWAAALAAVCDDVTAAQEVELRHLQPVRSFEVKATALVDHNSRVIGSTIVMHDVTGYRALQRSLAQANSELEERVAARTAELSTMRDALAGHVANLSNHLSVLYEVILLGGQSLDVAAVRDKTLETVMAALHAQGGFIMLWDAAASESNVVAAKGLADEDAAGLRALPAEWLFAETVPHTVLDISQPDVPAALRVREMQSCLTTSVQRFGMPVAAIGVFWRRQPALSVEAIALFRGLADQLSILAENARLRDIHDESLVQEERSRLARELHDSVTQALYALALSADTTVNALKNGRIEQLEHRLGRIAAAARQALREMRLLLYELRLAGPNRPPLAEALQLRLDAVESRAGIKVQLDVEPGLVLPEQWEQNLYWIAMEALNNALKHAAASRIHVSLAERDGEVELVVSDDGSGMAAEPGFLGGLGLRTMQERAAQLHGTLRIGRSQLGGVEVRLRVPRQPLEPSPSQPDTVPAAFAENSL